MNTSLNKIAEMVQRFDRSSPDELLQSIAAEIVRVGDAQAELTARLAQIEARASVAAAAQPCGMAIDAESSLARARGFQNLERDKQGAAYRWTGPDPEFSFELALDRSAVVEVALFFDKTFVESDWSRLRCRADGVEVALGVEPRKPRGYVARARLPVRPGSGDTQLAFLCAQTRSPREDGFDDDRRLGLLFRRLELSSGCAAAAAAPR
jgi:hypothetical protein